MNNDITSNVEALLKRHSYITGSFIKKTITEELKKSTSNSEIIVDKYDDLVEWIKTELGYPVIHIGVADSHYKQAIYSAIQLWWQHHYDGSYVSYKAIKITQSMIDSNELILMNNIESVLSINIIPNTSKLEPVMYSNLDWLEYNQHHSFNMSTIYTSNNWGDLSLSSMLALEMKLANINHMFKSHILFRYHRYENKVKFLDNTLKKLSVGSLVILEVYENVDTTKISNMFDDIWIKEYSRERLKLLWGTILKSIKNVPLIAGIPISGEEIYVEANEEIKRLEIQLTEKYEHPPMFYWG